MREALAGYILAVATLNAIAGSPALAVSNAYNDCSRLPADVASHAAYLWIGDLPEKQWDQFKQQIRYKLNTVSTEADVVQIYPVTVLDATSKTVIVPDLVRFDRRDPGPAFAKAWEATVDVDTIFHLQVETAEITEEEVEIGYATDASGKRVEQNAPGAIWHKTGTRKQAKKNVKGKRSVMAARVIEDCPSCRGWLPTTETAGLLLLTGSRSPILSGLWLWARLSRQLPLNNRDDGTGYYDFLGWSDRDAVFKTIRFNDADSVAVGRLLRAVVEAGDSGVAQNGRGVERLVAVSGPFWTTLDVDHTDGNQNPVHNLKRGELKAVAQELYVTLPNGLPGTFLCQLADGKRQDSAPDFIGANGDPGYGGQDLRIHAQLACQDCHGAFVLKPIRDWVRLNFDGPAYLLQSPDYNLSKDFSREFFRSIEKERARDSVAFVEAMQDVSGLKIEKLLDAENKMWALYANTAMDAEAVGRLVGVDEKILVDALKSENNAVHGIDPTLFPLMRPQGKVNRRTVEEQIPLIQAYLRSYLP